MKLRLGLLFATLALLATGCSGSVGSTPAPGPSASSTGKLAHIVILVQENRSFNNLFAGFPGANTAMEGLCKPPPPSLHFHGCKKEHEVPLHSVKLEYNGAPPEYVGQDICHTHQCFETECDPNASHICQMDGFDLVELGEGSSGAAAGFFPYAYVDRKETKPYWDFASQYTLADEMFFTETASSFIAHQMLISGTVRWNDHAWVTNQPLSPPWGCWSPPGDDAPLLYKDGRVGDFAAFPCFKWATIADLLDAKGVSWLFYVDKAFGKGSDFSGGVWNGFAGIHKIYYGPDFKKNISSPNTNLFSDLKAGTLPSLAWVIPRLYDSDHPAAGCNGGPWWVTNVINAIGTSQYWKNTAIIVLWDDWGGWYDNVPPKFINYSSLGFRVPMMVISPYARPSYVSHTQYDFGSILKFIEQTYDLGSLGTTDATATSMVNAFDFTQTPLTFKPEPVPKRSSSGTDMKWCTTHPSSDTPPSRKGVEEMIEKYGVPD
jgi:phospholipase C